MANVQGRHPQLLQAVMDINRDQRRLIVDKVRELLGELDGKLVGLLGLAFKPNTDDMRDAPAIEIAQLLQAGGASVQGYDPVAMVVAGRHMPGVRLCEDAYEAAGRRRRAGHLHRMERVQAARPGAAEAEHAPADHRRWAQYLRPENGGAPGLPLSRHGPRL